MLVKLACRFAVLFYCSVTLLNAEDQTVLGKLTVDQDAEETALVVRGGTSAKILAEFVRDNGTGGAISATQIDAVGNNPEMRFSDYTAIGTWVMGLKNSDNSFRISQNSNLHDDVNNYFTIKGNGSLDIQNSFVTSNGAITIKPQNTTYEGGQLVLDGTNAYESWNVDSYQDKFRVFNGSGVPFQISGVGNVGIGGGNSKRKLFVYNDSGGTYSSVAAFQTQNSWMDFSDTQLYFDSNITSGSSQLFLQDADNSDSRYIIETQGYNGAIDALMVSSSGKVGIGTRTLTEKLNVNGTIRAKEIIVETTGWSDFVFEENYELKSLSEVSVFIKENGHLPDIPSAEQVAEEGVTLGEMNARLLQKVEELTLYGIQQEKELAVIKLQYAQLIKRLERAGL